MSSSTPAKVGQQQNKPQNKTFVLKGMEKLQAILANPAQLNQKDKWGNTAVMDAASVNNTEALQKLLKMGARVDLKNNGGSSALILAASSGNTESARLLLEHGADVNQKGWKGVTPLLASVDNSIEISKGYPGAGRPVELVEVTQLLLAHGADIHAKRDDGKTALSIAKSRNMPEIIQLLQRKEAKKRK